ncbi:MAG: bifunctional folylpolyglutamate synthase/dihydrofolate synthase [Bacteroidota bacterium]|nr:bifunctional folylpolyglutamate synthase/dihydrofolate synthase [Bacteroidota bacterium]
MPALQPTLDYLYGLQMFGMKLGLRNIRLLLRSTGNPQNSFPSVHVAGTNGKGSTSSMIAAVLSASGYRVGLYTSPHLIRFNERIRVNGAMISNTDIVRLTNLLRATVDELHATFFEATTAIAFKYFQRQKVDIAVIETGLGGRLDATNVLRPLVAVITTIGKDHTQQLGTTLGKIAFEKGGIIKRGIPCVVGAVPQAALLVLNRIAEGRRSRFIQARHSSAMNNVHLPLLGIHQRENFQTAIAALEELKRCGFHISKESIRRGISRLSQLTGIHGRLEILSRSPLVILDVAHNPDGIKNAVATIQSLGFGKLHLVFGVMKDKDYRIMIRSLSALHPIVYAVQPHMERALEANAIVYEFFQRRCTGRAYASVEDGLTAALKNSKAKEMVLVTGSHYVAGDAWKKWKKKERKNS